MSNIAENDNLLAGILSTADKHPNSNVSKLIQETQRTPTIRNVVLLLNEIVQNVEYATNFEISLQYYLNLYQTLLPVQNACSLNEAGMLLEASAKIYDRRVDMVLDMVHAQLSSLRQATNENAKTAEKENIMPVAAEKVKRTRKRIVENIQDPCDLEMEVRKFRKLNSEKRFVDQKTDEEEARRLATINKQCRRINCDETDYIHPAACLHSVMPDLDTEGELDTKRNFKLFMHHVEHRYNTLVPDINFRLHFLMKDFIDEEQERTSDDEMSANDIDNRNWPPLSQAYVEKYVNLENQVLRLEHNLLYPTVETPADLDTQHFGSSSDDDECPRLVDNIVNSTPNALNSCTLDSGYCSATLATPEDEETLRKRITLNSTHDSLNGDHTMTATLQGQDSGIELSGITVSEEFSRTFNDLDANKENIEKLIERRMEKILINSYNMKLKRSENVDLSKVKVFLPNMNGGSVLFTELDAKTHRMLSPRVIAHDILGNKSKEDTFVANQVREMLSVLDALELTDEDMEKLQGGPSSRSERPQRKNTPSRITPITLNIMKFEIKLLQRQSVFKLGKDMDLFLQARSMKRPRNINAEATSNVAQKRKQFCAEDLRLGYLDDSDDDFLGFPDNESDFGEFCGFIEEGYQERSGFVKNRLQIIDRLHDEEEANTTNEQENTEIIGSHRTTTTHADCEVTTCAVEGTEMPGNQNPTEGNTDKSAAKESNDSLAVDAAAENTLIEDDTGDDRDENDVNDASHEAMKNSVDAELKRIEGSSCDRLTNVQEWHNSLRQHLANARERHHFDIFNIGTEIMSGLEASQEEVDKNVYTFEDVMQDKEESYVSRYFLSSLLLINQNNIGLSVKNKNSEKPAKWSDLKFKLLSTKRHTVSIEDNIGMVEHNNNDDNDNHDNDKIIQKDNLPKTTSTSITTKPTIRNMKKQNMLTSTFITMDEEDNDSFNSLEISSLSNSSESSMILHSSFEHVKINVDIIKPVKQVYKKLQTSDDHDSGFYSASLKSNTTN